MREGVTESPQNTEAGLLLVQDSHTESQQTQNPIQEGAPGTWPLGNERGRREVAFALFTELHFHTWPHRFLCCVPLSRPWPISPRHPGRQETAGTEAP